MNKYTVVISEQAQDDLDELSNVISYEYKAPISSIRYLRGIFVEMRKLSRSAESYKIETRKSLQQYGLSPRRVNFKRMAIIYNVINDVVYIRRVIPSNTIAGL
ncbi:MAG: hypothetical protein GZ091_15915 [Paludibacter sp.]|nr:hypothetical protein [Paludibacter sp.]